jgi:hypothetical protein
VSKAIARALLPLVAALGATTAVALATRGAGADEPRRVELAWIADPSCPSGEAVVSAVERLVRGSPPREVVVARGEVVHEGSWRVSLETRSGDRLGKRTIEAASCEQLADATALILALMIDPSAALRQPEPGAPHPPAPPPVAGEASRPAPEPPVPAPPEPRPPRPRASLFLAVAAVGDVGTLPAPAIGASASGGLSAGAYRFTVDIGAFPVQESRLVQHPQDGADFRLITGALVACRSWIAFWRVHAGPCLGAELDALWAQGFGVDRPRGGLARWGALLGGGLVEAPVAGPASVELRVAGTVPFARPPFYFDDIATLYRPSAAALRVHFAASLRF